MDPILAQLIIALIPAAEKLLFQVGGQLISINTSTLTDPKAIAAALTAAATEGFPILEFKSTVPVEPAK